MSYLAQSLLAQDSIFGSRVYAADLQQAHIFKDDARPSYVALASEIMRQGGGEVDVTFLRLAAAGPGIADKVDNGDGTISQENVTDADLLSLTQANWPLVADLYYAEDGSPIDA